MSRIPKIIVVTGAESTGKSTLCEALSSYFGVPYVPELARGYIENLNRDYNYEDVVEIAKQQIREVDEKLNSDHPFIILDTWLIITKIWFEVVFKKVPDWLESHIEKTKIDLFLLCDIDLPWVADNVRENGGKKREKLHNIYLNELQKRNYKYQLVTGQNENRIEKAIRIIEEGR
uniref:ATP-binding protein n=1 Tax=uncultured Draconibacterium sp. TaxID=1573823 RepID=UPI0032171812